MKVKLKANHTKRKKQLKQVLEIERENFRNLEYEYERLQRAYRLLGEERNEYKDDLKQAEKELKEIKDFRSFGEQGSIQLSRQYWEFLKQKHAIKV